MFDDDGYGSGTEPAHPMVGVLDAADAVFEQGTDVEVAALTDDQLPDVLARVHALAAKQAELFLRLLAEADTRDLGRRLGASSTTAWIRDTLRLRPGVAKASVDLAHRLTPPVPVEDYAANPAAGARSSRSMPATHAALLTGAVSVDHATVISKTMAQLPPDIAPEDAARAEEDLAAFAREHDPATLQRLATHLLHVLAAESLEDREKRAHRKRRLRLVDLGDGTVRITGLLSNEDAATIRTALDPLAAPNPSADGEPDPRTPEQRNADALIELCRRHLTHGDLPTRHGHPTQLLLLANLTTLLNHEPQDQQHAGHQQPDNRHPGNPHPGTTNGNSHDDTETHHANDTDRHGSDGTHNTGDHDGLLFVDLDQAEDPGPRRWLQDTWARRFGVAPAELTHNGPVSTGTARRLTCDATITPILLDQHGVPLRVGRTERTVTPGIYTALITRDRGCTFPGCTRPPAWCHTHHITHWANEGPTNLDNLALLCGHHHRTIHHSGWDIHIATDGHPEFLPPPWIDPHRTPRRNTRPRHDHQRPPPDG